VQFSSLGINDGVDFDTYGSNAPIIDRLSIARGWVAFENVLSDENYMTKTNYDDLASSCIVKKLEYMACQKSHTVGRIAVEKETCMHMLEMQECNCM
ncbi:hypothetical protein KI387_039967, partial [Taxus chinensis]